MKKLLIMALMVAAATTSYAQDEAAKAILKAKTYDEAESLLKQSESSLSAEAKAKVYNKLAQLAMKKVKDEEAIVDQNNLNAQLNPGATPQPYDTVGLYNSAWLVLDNAENCDKYDNQPNAKGKVAPKFHKTNQSAYWYLRNHLLTAGQYYYEKQDYKSALKYYGTYVDSESFSLFSDFDKVKNSNGVSLGEVARVSAVYAMQLKDVDLAHHYCDVALADTASHNDAVDLKMYLCQQGLTCKEDSVKALEQLRQFYAKENTENVFAAVASMIGGVEGTDKQNAFIDSRIASNPDSPMAWALKGQNQMNAQQYDDAIASFKKSIASKERAILYTYIGFCYTQKAAADQNPTTQKSLLEEAVTYLEKSKALDPDRQESNWSYPLYSCYYNLYGEADSRTKELESLVK